MKFIPQSIPDIILIEPKIHIDDRGYFVETFRQDLFEKHIGYKVNFLQDNESKSAKGVLRGLHYQLPPYAQAKLVSVIDGIVLDISVDIRKSSPTFGQHVSAVLSSTNKEHLYVPHGFAHGFVVLSESATFTYKVDNYYSPDSERGIYFDDPQLGIDLKLDFKDLILSEKDKIFPTLKNSSDLF